MERLNAGAAQMLKNIAKNYKEKRQRKQKNNFNKDRRKFMLEVSAFAVGAVLFPQDILKSAQSIEKEKAFAYMLDDILEKSERVKVRIAPGKERLALKAAAELDKLAAKTYSGVKIVAVRMKDEQGKEIWEIRDGNKKWGTAQFVNEKTLEMEKYILKYTNMERKKLGLGGLKLDLELELVAREHSIDMAINNYDTHVDSKGQNPTQRLEKENYTVNRMIGGVEYKGIGENVAFMPTGEVTGVGDVEDSADGVASAFVDAWMRSPGHRANILNGKYQKIGVGASKDGVNYEVRENAIFRYGMAYRATQNFF